MEIIKQLNLNGNPQTVPNGSLVYAKNIKISPDGTYITNDDGFELAFVSSEPNASDLKVDNVRTSITSGNTTESLFRTGIELKQNAGSIGYGTQKIAGYINCPNEVVILVYRTGRASRETFYVGEIYRAVELKNSNKLALYYVPSAWQCHGGDIVGTYIYNVYNQLIVSIAESNALIDKEIVTINLNTSSNYDDSNLYSCAPKIPICNLKCMDRIKGVPMQQGLYYFFIRYEIIKEVYTNWFSIGAPQYALSLDYKTIVNHRYPLSDSGTNTEYAQASVLINTDKQAYYNFSFNIEFEYVPSFIGYQIGYILQTEDTSVGRIWKQFNFDGQINRNFVFDGGFIEEEDLESFSNNVINFYNVKALANYNNKLFISNFKETEYNVYNDDIQSCVSNIIARQIKRKVDTSNISSGQVRLTTWTYTIDNQSTSITVPENVTEVPLTQWPGLLAILREKIATALTFPDTYSIVLNENELRVNPEKEYGGVDAVGSPWYYYTGPSRGDFVWQQYDYLDTGPDGSGEYVSGQKGYMDADVSITKVTTAQDYNTYNSDVIIRTLMPNEVYSFYVHFVRADGSFTNGFMLENDAHGANWDYTLVKDMAVAQFDGLVRIEELWDKYGYELPENYVLSGETIYKSKFMPYYNEQGKKLFKTGNGVEKIDDVVDFYRIGVKFENIKIPEGFVGCFFSYEKVNPLCVYQGVVTEDILNTNSILIKANEVESYNSRYDGVLFYAHHIIDSNGLNDVTQYRYSYINNAAPVLSNALIDFIGTTNAIVDRTGKEGGIAMNLTNDGQSYQPSVGVIGSIILFNRSIYNSKYKELIPFGPIIYGDTSGNNRLTYGEEESDTDTTINYDMNYPSFLTQDKFLIYKDSILINEKAEVISRNSDSLFYPNGYYQSGNYAEIKTYWKFSNINLLALSIKKAPVEKVGVIYNDKNSINVLVEPVNASDLFKLESCYIPQIHKAYTNYNINTPSETVLTNVIRASYPIQNESNVNNWRIFDPLAYYVINNSHGDVVNIFGASSSFFIHTKNNLLVTTSNAKLSADNVEINIVNNNIFDVEPKEIFSSELGYGGLKHRVCHLFSQFGYIWYDTERYKLFRYDNGQLTDMTSGLDEIIRKYKYEYCFINIDNDNNRLIFSFVRDDKTLTMSYETLTGKWISIHDYVFDKSMHTANIAIFSYTDKDNDTANHVIRIMGYDKSADKADYKNLYVATPDLPNYQVSSSVCKYCCFDIIFNPEYMSPKVLDSITWAHEIIQENTLNSNHPAELKNIFTDGINDKLNDLTGMNILIYTDSVDSGLLNVKDNQTKINDVTSVTSYKYPYYDKGVWHFNYFRNNIIEPATEQDISALCTKYKIDENSPYFTKLKNIYKVMDRNNESIYRTSDMNSLIYGKYIVVRFVFTTVDTNRKIKFDNLQVNLKRV